MSHLFRIVPFVGTFINGVETLEAIIEGNGKKALWKLGATALGGAMDVFTVASLGTSSIATTSAKNAVNAVNAAGKVVAATGARAVGDAVAQSESEKCDDISKIFRSGGGGCGGGSNGGCGGAGGSGGGDKSWQKEKSNHEMELDKEGSPITSVVTDTYGRVSLLYAEIQAKHLHCRKYGDKRGKIRPEVDRYVRTLDKMAIDQIGHIIAWCLGGPNNYVYNYFPQHPKSNRNLYDELEIRIKHFLECYPNGRVYFRVQLLYYGCCKRPYAMDYYVLFWKDKHTAEEANIYWNNDGTTKLSKPEYRRVFDPKFNGHVLEVVVRH